FAGAFAKRHSGYGPLGPGGIYAIDRANSNVIQAVTVTNAGTTAHDSADWFHDQFFWDAPGKQALGDLELSADEKTLYVVNLAEKTLLEYDVTPGWIAPLTLLRSTPIPNPGCGGGANDWRPFALGLYEGLLYVGGVCSGETGGTNSLSVTVYRTDVGGASVSFTDVLSHPLDFDRGPAWIEPVWGFTDNLATPWNPWESEFVTSNWNLFSPANQATHPQPLLTDLAFDRDGSMILGFRDRFGDQVGSATGSTNTLDATSYSIVSSGGDINRACWDGTTWNWEGEGGCPNNHTGSNGGNQAPSVVEYYPGEFFLFTAGHFELAQGGLSFAPRFSDITTTAVDPSINEVDAGGVLFIDNQTGLTVSNSLRGYTLFRGSGVQGQSLWGKANGLGDVEFLCVEPEIEIGNYVFLDVDADGVQDPADTPIGGVTVVLYSNATAIATTVTDAVTGEYYFNSNNVPGGIAFFATNVYQVRIDLADTNLGGATPTLLDQAPLGDGDDDLRDSDGNTNLVPGFAVAVVTTGGPGDNDHSYDFGLVPPNNVAVGDYVWIDEDGDGIQDAAESNGVAGVTVTLFDSMTNAVATNTTDVGGLYLFTNLASGSYFVQFDLSTLPAGFIATLQDQGGDDAVDSDADR
ncbi:MAG: SdrD B-like domain-containing protein, partial [Verrucomicrobiota bacterium]